MRRAIDRMTSGSADATQPSEGKLSDGWCAGSAHGFHCTHEQRADRVNTCWKGVVDVDLDSCGLTGQVFSDGSRKQRLALSVGWQKVAPTVCRVARHTAALLLTGSLELRRRHPGNPPCGRAPFCVNRKGGAQPAPQVPRTPGPRCLVPGPGWGLDRDQWSAGRYPSTRRPTIRRPIACRK